MAIWSNIGCGSRKKSARVPCGSRAVPHVGSQMGAKLELNRVKMAFEIASKLAVDFEMLFFIEKGGKSEPTWQPNWVQNGVKAVPRSDEHAKAEYAKSVVLSTENRVFEPLRAAV